MPVTDLRSRSRNAGVSREQADAISGALEALSSQVNDLSCQIRISEKLDGLVVKVPAKQF